MRGTYVFRQSGSSVTLWSTLPDGECKAHRPNSLQKCCFRSILPVLWARDPPEETQLLKVLCSLPVTDDERPEGVRV